MRARLIRIHAEVRWHPSPRACQRGSTQPVALGDVLARGVPKRVDSVPLPGAVRREQKRELECGYDNLSDHFPRPSPCASISSCGPTTRCCQPRMRTRRERRAPEVAWKHSVRLARLRCQPRDEMRAPAIAPTWPNAATLVAVSDRQASQPANAPMGRTEHRQQRSRRENHRRSYESSQIGGTRDIRR